MFTKQGQTGTEVFSVKRKKSQKTAEFRRKKNLKKKSTGFFLYFVLFCLYIFTLLSLSAVLLYYVNLLAATYGNTN